MLKRGVVLLKQYRTAQTRFAELCTPSDMIIEDKLLSKEKILRQCTGAVKKGLYFIFGHSYRDSDKYYLVPV